MSNEWHSLMPRLRKLEEIVETKNAVVDAEIKRIDSNLEARFEGVEKRFAILMGLLIYLGAVATAILAKMLEIIP